MNLLKRKNNSIFTEVKYYLIFIIIRIYLITYIVLTYTHTVSKHIKNISFSNESDSVICKKKSRENSFLAKRF